MRKAPALRNNNGALYLWLCLDERDHVMNRLGRFDNSVAHVQGANYFSCDLSEYSAAMSGFFYFTISKAN